MRELTKEFRKEFEKLIEKHCNHDLEANLNIAKALYLATYAQEKFLVQHDIKKEEKKSTLANLTW
jgi:hypothetical protein